LWRKKLVESRLAGETEVLGETLPQRHFVDHKSHMSRPGFEPGSAAVESQRLTASAIARPFSFPTVLSLQLNLFSACLFKQ
jgi:hypothetical protein